MKASRTVMGICLALLSAASARAEVTMLLSSAVQNSAAGREIVLSGSLTNGSATEKVYLNDVVATLSGVSTGNLVLRPNAYFANVPGVLLPGETYANSEIVRVLLKGTAPASDYGGTITFRGGSSVFAAESLTSAAFTVLSPAVTMVATDASASERGPDGGLFTVSRSGSATIDLAVFFTKSGGATSGIDYQASASFVVIPAGSSRATIPVVPIPNNLAQGDRTVLFSLASALTYNLSNPASAGVTIHDKPADAWRFENFGANANDAAAADAADWDGDGIANLLEFALGLDPKMPTANALPVAVKSDGYLTISYLPNTGATDVNIVAEASTDLLRWSSEEVELLSVLPETYRYRIPLTQTGRAFLRLHLFRTDL